MILKIRKKEIKERHILFGLIFLYFLTRLLFLTKLPIFNDEATYLDWSYRQINLRGEFFHSVLHAKTPLYMWIVGALRKVITDPLMAGRFVSVTAGLLTVYGLYKLAEELFNKKSAVIIFILYTAIPIFAFFDRQALMESSVSASGIWSFYFFLKLIKNYEYKDAGILGVILGLGYLTKTSAIVFFLSVVALLILEIFRNKKKANRIINNLFILFTIYMITLSPLLLQPAFWETLGDNKRYIFTLNELVKFPLKQWVENIKNFLIITLLYLNPLILLAGLISIYSNLREKKLNSIYALFLFFIGSAFVIFVSRSATVRYLAPFLPLFLLFPAYLFSDLIKKKKASGIAFLSLSIIPSSVITLLLIFSPIRYFNLLDNFSKHSQKKDYVTYWSSGYGFDEVKKYIEEISKNQKIVVGVRLDAGIPENAVFTYFSDSKRVFPIYLDKRLIKDFESFECFKSKVPVYFVSRDNHLAGFDKHLIELKRVYKHEGDYYIGIHQLKTTGCEGKSLNII